MKLFRALTFLLLTVLSLTGKSQTNNTYNGFPLIKANHNIVDFKIGDDWIKSSWKISPEIENDTLKVPCISPVENFIFKTDMDSIEYNIKIGDTERFYVLLNDSMYAHTVIVGINFPAQKVEYNSSDKNEDIKIFYQTKPDTYLNDLKKAYPLNEVIENDKSDQEKILSVLNWTHSQWEHNGNNSPKKKDAISILNEARDGGSFPCFAYAIVLRDQLNALGYKARTIYLKTKDAKNSKYSPGHAATEVYLEDLKKWAFIDGQFNIMPSLNNVPLNAVEFQKAISNNYNELELLSKDKIPKRLYIKFVYNYLYYYDTSLDNRYSIKDRYKINGKKSLMLVPVGAKNLTRIDFWDMDIDHCIYTHSLMDFYANPN